MEEQVATTTARISSQNGSLSITSGKQLLLSSPSSVLIPGCSSDRNNRNTNVGEFIIPIPSARQDQQKTHNLSGLSKSPLWNPSERQSSLLAIQSELAHVFATVLSKLASFESLLSDENILPHLNEITHLVEMWAPIKLASLVRRHDTKTYDEYSWRPVFACHKLLCKFFGKLVATISFFCRSRPKFDDEVFEKLLYLSNKLEANTVLHDCFEPKESSRFPRQPCIKLCGLNSKKLRSGCVRSALGFDSTRIGHKKLSLNTFEYELGLSCGLLFRMDTGKFPVPKLRTLESTQTAFTRHQSRLKKFDLGATKHGGVVLIMFNVFSSLCANKAESELLRLQNWCIVCLQIHINQMNHWKRICVEVFATNLVKNHLHTACVLYYESLVLFLAWSNFFRVTRRELHGSVSLFLRKMGAIVGNMQEEVGNFFRTASSAICSVAIGAKQYCIPGNQKVVKEGGRATWSDLLLKHYLNDMFRNVHAIADHNAFEKSLAPKVVPGVRAHLCLFMAFLTESSLYSIEKHLVKKNIKISLSGASRLCQELLSVKQFWDHNCMIVNKVSPASVNFTRWHNIFQLLFEPVPTASHLVAAASQAADDAELALCDSNVWSTRRSPLARSVDVVMALSKQVDMFLADPRHG
jgi:hypothetical protein